MQCAESYPVYIAYRAFFWLLLIILQTLYLFVALFAPSLALEAGKWGSNGGSLHSRHFPSIFHAGRSSKRASNASERARGEQKVERSGEGVNKTRRSGRRGRGWGGKESIHFMPHFLPLLVIVSHSLAVLFPLCFWKWTKAKLEVKLSTRIQSFHIIVTLARARTRALSSHSVHCTNHLGQCTPQEGWGIKGFVINWTREWYSSKLLVGVCCPNLETCIL